MDTQKAGKWSGVSGRISARGGSQALRDQSILQDPIEPLLRYSGLLKKQRLLAGRGIVLMASGLSVIIDGIKESRKTFKPMNSYAIYRIAETIRVQLFRTLSILIFNFYPVTAVMIVLLALVNDGPVLAIAYDNSRYGNQPESWNMPLVLQISTVLGIA